jgi:hypothetical protein
VNTERKGSCHHLLLGFWDGLQEVAGKVHAAALPTAALEHPPHRLGQPHVGVGHHQAHAIQAALFEAAQKLAPEGLALSVTHLQAQ